MMEVRCIQLRILKRNERGLVGTELNECVTAKREREREREREKDMLLRTVGKCVSKKNNKREMNKNTREQAWPSREEPLESNLTL